MNKRGFTLIELLAVITILGIIMVVAFPGTIALLRNNDQHLSENLGKTMIEAAKKYVNDERIDGVGCKTIEASDLISKKLLKSLTVNDNKFSCTNGEVYVTFYSDTENKDTEYSYKLEGCNTTVSTYNSTDASNNSTVPISCGDFVAKSKGVIAIDPNFNKPSVDSLGSNYIPIKFDKDGKIYRADSQNLKRNSWYDYINKRWANMANVSLDGSSINVGDEIDKSNINDIYVWIPRFCYKQGDENRVSVKFVSSTITTDASLSPEALETNDTSCPAGYSIPTVFANNNIQGFWFAKYALDANEKSIANSSFKSVCNIDDFNNLTVNNITHYMTNSEYAAVRLLSASQYGNYDDVVNHKYDFKLNQGDTEASVTTGYSLGGNNVGNNYGIYDMYVPNSFYYTDACYGDNCTTVNEKDTANTEKNAFNTVAIKDNFLNDKDTFPDNISYTKDEWLKSSYCAGNTNKVCKTVSDAGCIKDDTSFNLDVSEGFRIIRSVQQDNNYINTSSYLYIVNNKKVKDLKNVPLQCEELFNQFVVNGAAYKKDEKCLLRRVITQN